MPFTFCHPAAVLPLRGFSTLRLNFAALVIGSLTPDFGYYLSCFEFASYAHTAPGVFLACLPSGLGLLAVFYLVRRPVCFLLPMPHRAALAPLCSSWPRLDPLSVIMALLSIVLGAWTHTLWDSFTHESGWFVTRIWWLRAPLFTTPTGAVRVAYLLQQFSTVAGAVILFVVYRTWLRRQPATADPERPSDRPRYFLWAAMILFAAALSLPAAARVAATFGPSHMLRAFAFRFTVFSIAVLIPLSIVTALIISAAPGPQTRS